VQWGQFIGQHSSFHSNDEISIPETRSLCHMEFEF
jgi:hypothetical protein